VTPHALEVDHLVIAATDLEQGARWCESWLGVPLEPGGRHARFGTHNRLLYVSSARHPRCYLEILAIDPDAAAPAQARWFGLDDPALQRELAARPRPVQWVARVPPGRDIDAIASDWRRAGADPGETTAAERMTPRGLLRWRLTVRADGRRPFGGALPALNEWGDEHPTQSLGPRGVSIASLVAPGLPAAAVAALPASIREASELESARGRTSAALRIELDTPRGRIALEAPREDETC